MKNCENCYLNVKSKHLGRYICDKETKHHTTKQCPEWTRIPYKRNKIKCQSTTLID